MFIATNFIATVGSEIFRYDRDLLQQFEVYYNKKFCCNKAFRCNSLLPQTLSQQWATNFFHCNKSLLQQFEVYCHKKFHCNKAFFLKYFVIWYFISNFTNLYQKLKFFFQRFFNIYIYIYIMNYNYGISLVFF